MLSSEYMSIDNPTNRPAITEEERLENEQQTARETLCRELFIRDEVSKLTISPEQEAFLVEYLQTRAGTWREYDGVDVTVMESRVEGDVLRVAFCVYVEEIGSYGVDERIPLSKNT